MDLLTSLLSCLCMCDKSLQLCLTLCDSVDSSLPGSSVHGILQARILEGVATSFPRRSSPPRIEPMSVTSPALANWIFTAGATWEDPCLLYFTRTLQDCILEKICLLLPWLQRWSKSKIALFSEPCEV